MSRALVVIDVQRALIEHPGAHRPREVLDNIAGLLERARAAGTPVVFVQHDGDAGEALEPGTPGWEIHPAVAPREHEPVVRKRASDSFWHSRLADVLDGAGVGELVLTGMRTEMCVDTTARAAVSRGYAVTLVADSHTTTDGERLTADAVVQHHNHVLDDFGNDEAVVELRNAADVAL